MSLFDKTYPQWTLKRLSLPQPSAGTGVLRSWKVTRGVVVGLVIRRKGLRVWLQYTVILSKLTFMVEL